MKDVVKLMLKTCSICEKMHDINIQCLNKPKRIYTKMNTDISKFRNTSAWQKKREQIKRRDNYMCIACLKGLKGTVKRLNISNLSVHHITSLSENFEKRLDDDNLITLCHMHHEMADNGVLSKKELRLSISPPDNQ